MPSKLHPVTLKDMQATLDAGTHSLEQMVDSYHAELGTQKALLKEEILALSPSPDSPAGKRLAAEVAKAAKDLADAEAKAAKK